MSTKINFVFEKCTTIEAVSDYRSSVLDSYLIYYQSAFPFEISVVHLEKFTDPLPLKNGDIWVYCPPFCRPYIERPETKTAFLHLHALDDNYENVVILADYSHETSIPGPFKNAKRHDGQGFAQWLEFERYVLTILSLGFENIDFHYPWKAVVPTWNFVSQIVQQISGYHGNKLDNVQNLVSDPKKLYRYLILNRIARHHRLEFLGHADDANMLDDALWNLQLPGGTDPSASTIPWYTNKYGNGPRYLPEPWTQWSKELLQPLPLDLVEQCEIYIGTDTFNDFIYNDDSNPTNYPADENKPMVLHDISEKSIKGFIYGMPSFINNRVGAVQVLKDLGFWCPGDYDNIQDNHKRMQKLIADAQDFELEKDHEELLKHNKNLIMDKNLHYRTSQKLFDTIYELTNA